MFIMITNPAWTLAAFALALVVFLIYFGKTRGCALPLRLPKIAGRPDPNSPKPGRKSLNMAGGILTWETKPKTPGRCGWTSGTW
jgi:hypothetical protein